MGDENTADEKDIKSEGADNKTADEKKDITAGDGSDTKSDKKVEDTSDKKDEKTTDEIDENEEPSVRKKSNLAFILERKTAKINKLQEKKVEHKGGGEGDDEDEEENETDNKDDVIDPTDKELIQKEVANHLKPILDREDANETKAEVTSFITTNPDFKPFEAKILKFASHESRKNMPISAIAYEVAGPALLKMGAERARKADIEAKEHESGGGSGGGTGEGEGKGIWEMSVDEFKAKQREVMGRQQN